jgi:hypothetical protein
VAAGARARATLGSVLFLTGVFPGYAIAHALGPVGAAWLLRAAELPAARRLLNHVANRYLLPGSGGPRFRLPAAHVS